MGEDSTVPGPEGPRGASAFSELEHEFRMLGTMPVGYRPLASKVYAIGANGTGLSSGQGSVEFQPGGAVMVRSNVQTSLLNVHCSYPLD